MVLLLMPGVGRTWHHYRTGQTRRALRGGAELAAAVIFTVALALFGYLPT